MKRGMRWLGLGLCGVVAFGIFLYWSFPFDALQGRLGKFLEQQLGGHYAVTLGTIESHWLSGVDLHDVTISPRGTPDEPTLKLPRLRLRVALTSLLFGSPAVAFTADLEHGRISGRGAQSEEGPVVELALDAVELQQFGFLEAATGLKLAGRVDGDVALTVNPRQVKAIDGTIDLHFAEWKVRKGSSVLQKFGTMFGIALDDEHRLSGKDGSGMQIKIEKGTATVTSLKLADGDLGIDLSGQVFLQRPFEASRLNLKGELQLSEKLKKLLPVAMLGTPTERGGFPVEVSGQLSRGQGKLGSFPIVWPFPQP